ncbi:MAG: hypothetical protein COV44_05505 [Deltaproteobacteria bacterium CG11_big_fil_rev_8_21_14_0_20_45_16]|nr:MAG: hypothetical protein COV44_05505 [Deltaproteobacteria bacterium CG11_big_fil_rev_8_21_14_0_20_45_16]
MKLFAIPVQLAVLRKDFDRYKGDLRGFCSSGEPILFARITIRDWLHAILIQPAAIKFLNKICPSQKPAIYLVR